MYELGTRGDQVLDENGLVVAEVRTWADAREIVAALNFMEKVAEAFPGLVNGIVHSADDSKFFVTKQDAGAKRQVGSPGHLERWAGGWHREVYCEGSMNIDEFSTIEVGDLVTIRVPSGKDWCPATKSYVQTYSHRQGRVVMRGPAGFVLNCGGRHGTPRVADETNTVRVRKRRTV